MRAAFIVGNMGGMRKVWIFPLKPINGAPVVSVADFEAVQENKRKQAEAMSHAK